MPGQAGDSDQMAREKLLKLKLLRGGLSVSRSRLGARGKKAVTWLRGSMLVSTKVILDIIGNVGL
jgi:hypothetical protein